jgi:uncharacterized membrane protein
MTYRFNRRALLLPLLLPLAALPVALLVLVPGDTSLLGVSSGIAAWLVVAGLIYVVPYLLVLAIVYPRIETWSRRSIWTRGLSLGLGVAALPPLCLLITQLASADDPLDGVGALAMLSIGVAMIYTLLVLAAGEYLGRRRATSTNVADA